MLSRRDLLLATGAVAFRTDTLATILKADYATSVSVESAARDEGYWAKIRSAFDVERDFLYLNNGGACPSPRAVRRAAQARVDTAARAPAYYLFRKQEREVDAVRERLAKLFGASPEEIAVTQNASQGLFATIMGLKMGSGDRIVTTSHDYPRVLTAVHQRGRRDGVIPTVVDTPVRPDSPEALAAPVRRALALRPKLVAIPRVSYLDGAVFPVREICDAAREVGAFSLVDGAHGIGQLPDTAPTLGCDAYATCLHKWMLAPVGTGFLYLRREAIPNVWPLYPADESLDGNIRKFEQFGTHNTGILLSIHEALDAHEAIGTDRKGARLAYLREQLFKKLEDIPGIEFGSPRPPELGRVLTAVRLKNKPSEALATTLTADHKIFVTTTRLAGQSYLRVSPQIFTTPEELDRLASALKAEVDRP